MRAWWSENGNYVIGGIVVGIIIIFGLNQYRSTVAEAEIAASTLYEDVMFAAGTGDLDAAEEAAAKLYSDYDSTAYAAQARLALARLYMDNARDQDAAEVLSGLIASNPDTELAMVGRLRLAKILLYQGKAEEVVGLIQDLPDSAFSARMNEVLGDAYVVLGRYEEAQAAYIAALSDNPVARTVDTSLIQLKINDLPDLSGQPADPAAADVIEPEMESVEGGEEAPGETDPIDETSSEDAAAEAPPENEAAGND